MANRIDCAKCKQKQLTVTVHGLRTNSAITFLLEIIYFIAKRECAFDWISCFNGFAYLKRNGCTQKICVDVHADGMHKLRLQYECLWYRWFVIGNQLNQFILQLKNLFQATFSFLQIHSDQMTKEQHNQILAENQISAQIIALLEHYKQNDPIGMPGNLVPDPFPMPDSEQSLPMASTLTTTDSKAYGLSKFRIRNIAFDLYHMMVRCLLWISGTRSWK